MAVLQNNILAGAAGQTGGAAGDVHTLYPSR